MVPLHRSPAKPVTSIARFKRKPDVCRSSRIHKIGEFRRIYSREYHLRTESQPAVGSQCRTFFPDRRVIPARFLPRKETIVCLLGSPFPLMGKNFGLFGNRICSIVFAERTCHGKRCNRTTNSRNRVRHVAKTGIYTCFGRIFRHTLPKQGIQQHGRRPAFLWENEPYNYITQSVVGSVIYFPFGLYLAPYCGYTLSLCIGWMVFLLQVAFCKWWLGKHKQGPLEYIWHKWTWIGTKK